jgi:hypothetical protein
MGIQDAEVGIPHSKFLILNSKCRLAKDLNTIRTPARTRSFTFSMDRNTAGGGLTAKFGKKRYILQR